MPISLRSHRVDVFRLSTATVKGRSTATYTQVSSGEADHAFAARVTAVTARESQIAQQQQHLTDVMAVFGAEVVAALTVNGKLSTDGAIRHDGRVYKITGARGPAGPGREWVLHAVHASGDVIANLVPIGGPPVLTSLVITPSLGIEVGSTRQYSVQGLDQYGQPISFSGGTWSTSNAGRATINSSGLATGVGAGSVDIIFTKDAIVGTLPVVITLTLFAIDVTPVNPTLAIGATQQFTATGRNVNSVPVPLVGTVWASDDLAAVTVNGSGLATGVAEGDAVISATVGVIAGTSTVTVPAAGGAVLEDTFTAANGTALNGRAADTGQLWTAPAGYEIQNNRGFQISFTQDPAHIDAGIADFASCAIDLLGANDHWMVFRYVDVNNHFIVGMPAGTPLTPACYKRVAGSYSLVGTGANVASHQTRPSVEASGANLDISFDGVFKFSATETAHQTATRVGFVGGSALDVDNLEVIA